jgi:hypothetical protein
MASITERLSGTTFGTLNTIQKSIFVITTTGAATATLPNGSEGQRILLFLITDAGDLVVSGSFSLGSTATFDTVKDAVELIWIINVGWHVISNSAVVFA